MQRIAVIGCAGSGKSTFARRLGRVLGIEATHLDAWYWRPGWVATPRDEWRSVQQRLVAGERWIIDGNYAATLDIRLERAGTIVFFDLPRRTCLFGLLRRWARHRGRPLQAPGCPERLSWELARWVTRYRRHSRPKVMAAIARHAPQAQLIVIGTRQTASETLARAAAATPRAGEAHRPRPSTWRSSPPR